MGGLVDGATVKGDLWVVEAGTYPLKCYQLETSNEGPGPRVGHACLVAGNAFIVFGGDTKIDDHDILDDTLYLLNIGKIMILQRATVADVHQMVNTGHE